MESLIQKTKYNLTKLENNYRILIASLIRRGDHIYECIYCSILEVFPFSIYYKGSSEFESLCETTRCWIVCDGCEGKICPECALNSAHSNDIVICNNCTQKSSYLKR